MLNPVSPTPRASKKNKLKCIIFAFAVYLISSITSAQTQILSGQLGETLSESSFTQTGFFNITPDGTKVLFGARSVEMVQNEEFGRELYMVNVDGSDPVKLLDYATYRYFANPTFTSDSKYVVVEANGQLVTIDLSTRNVTTLTNSVAERVFKLSPDNQFVVYTNLFGSEFHSVPITGGTIERIDAVSISSFDSNDFKVSHDSQHVIFSLRDIDTGASSLLKAPIRGGTNIELLPPGDHDLFNWKISPDDNAVLYQLNARPAKLYSINLQSLAKTVLSTSNGDGFIRFWIAPNSNRVLYTKHESDSASSLNLFETDISGSFETKLVTPSSDFDYICDFGYSATSEHAFLCAWDENSVAYLFAINFNGGTTVTRLAPDTSLSILEIDTEFTTDFSKLVVYNRSETGVPEEYLHRLFSIDIATNSSVNLFSYKGFLSDCIDKQFSQSASNLTFCAENEKGNGQSLYSRRGNNNEQETDNTETPIFFKTNATGDTVIYVNYQYINGQGNYTLRSRLLNDMTTELCVPVVAANSRTAIICL